MAATAGGELRAAGADRHRPGAPSSLADSEPLHEAAARVDQTAIIARAGENPAVRRRLSRGDPSDGLRCDEPDRRRPSRTCGGRAWRPVPAAVGERRWMLAHR